MSKVARASEFSGLRVAVVGLGMTGHACVRALREVGAEPYLFDTRRPHELPKRMVDAAQELRCPLELGSNRSLSDCQLVVVSPGLSIRSNFLAPARARDVEVMGEIELASRLRPEARFVGITGTNGKSTTTALTARILERAGIPVALCGNIGSPLVTHVLEREDDPVFVVELSSFQLEGVRSFRARAAALLNVTDDHRDRHPDLAEYVGAKMRIFAKQCDGDLALLSADCPQLAAAHLVLPRERVARFSVYREVARGGYVRDGALWVRLEDGAEPTRLLAVDEMLMRGPHNQANALAATCLALQVGAPLEAAEATLRVFEPAPHTMRPVGSVNCVLYVNDSKGTNVDATVQALRSCVRPVVLIAGGSEKGADFAPLGPEIAARCRGVVLIGQTAERIRESAERAGFTAIAQADSMDAAVAAATEMAESGDVVLLSPACASFDMFADYKQRGELFEEAVSRLPGFTASAPQSDAGR